MERLTKWNESSYKHAYYPRCFKEPCYGSGCKIKDCPFEIAVCERLAAYEDIGLTPEEIKAPFTEDAMINLAAQALGVEPSRLRELAEADKDGRVVVKPCKVGETVYFVNAKQILEFAVVGYAVDETGISWVHSEHVDKIGNTNERTFSPDRFGKNTFFTHEEAEKALREMEGKKDGKT
jgi:hypothetical protein